MFTWNIAKSAEAMFSRWAIKKVFKFLLKKKLGQFILGDIDVNQLDVQLRNGTVQLSDLALNVDYINLKVRPLVLNFDRYVMFVYLFFVDFCGFACCFSRIYAIVSNRMMS